MRTLIPSLRSAPGYWLLVQFFALYPILMALVWTWGGLLHYLFRERNVPAEFYDIPEHRLPFVSLVIPAFKESLTECATMAAGTTLDYPFYEVVVVDDGSPDDTLAKACSCLTDPRVRVFHKAINEGKALALNDALPLLRGDLVMVIDGDATPHPDVLRWLVPHFVRDAGIGAVTARPRPRNCENVLERIQSVEYASIVSLVKRAQMLWGRIMTVSGVATMWRKEALTECGMFCPDADTEDIATSWKLHRHQWDIRYEPNARVDMQVPSTFVALWRQRLRWARGLAQVLRRNAGFVKDRCCWSLLPVYVESVLSVLWAYSFVALVLLWLLTWATPGPRLGVSPIPEWWGFLIATASVVQLSAGIFIDSRYDPDILPGVFWIPLYPLIYWIQMSVVTVIATPGGLLHPYGTGRWGPVRSRD